MKKIKLIDEDYPLVGSLDKTTRRLAVNEVIHVKEDVELVNRIWRSTGKISKMYATMPYGMYVIVHKERRTLTLVQLFGQSPYAYRVSINKLLKVITKSPDDAFDKFVRLVR